LTTSSGKKANHGEYRIDINNGKKNITVNGGETLLASLTSRGIAVPSVCGGRGVCAYCKVKIHEGGGPLMPTEQPLLSPEEIEDNVRISCQVKVHNDMTIEVPEELFKIKKFRGRVDLITDLTHDIKQLRISLVEPDTIEFTPGQYIQLQAPAYGSNPEPVYRAYSISSPPEDSGALELVIRLVPEGICTTWVFEHLEEGQEVVFRGPYGDFRLSETDKEMIWIAGGSGMAPFWSMIRHMKNQNISRSCRYFFGAVAKRDLFLVDELEALADKLDWFEFIPALSGPDENDKWNGQTGLVTEVLDRHIEDGSDLEGYLCGSTGMIDASVKVLKNRNIPESRIFYDKFN